MRRSGSRVTAALAAAAALVLAGGCSDDGAEHRDTVRAAGVRTVEAGSAKVSITVRTGLGGAETTLTGEGSYDLSGSRGALSLDLGSLLAGTTLQATVIGDQAYVVPPALVAGLVGKPFLRVDLALLLEDSPQFGPLGSTANPVASVAALGRAVDAEEIGEESVRGEVTTHYGGTLDLGAASAEAGAGSEDQVVRLRALLGVDRVPYDVWLDDEGRVRRVTLTGRATATPAGGTATATSTAATTVTTELYEYGAVVDVTAPAADQTADGNALLRTLGGSSS